MAGFFQLGLPPPVGHPPGLRLLSELPLLVGQFLGHVVQRPWLASAYLFTSRSRFLDGGNFLTMRGASGSCTLTRKTFSGWGRVRKAAGFPLRTPAPVPSRACRCGRSLPPRTESQIPAPVSPFFGLFSGRFAVVAGLAQALVVSRVDELAPVPPVWYDVVHHRGPDAVPGITWRIPRGALAAERLPQELRRAQVVRPDGQAVPAVVLPPRLGGALSGACAWGSTPPGSGPHILGAGMAGAVSGPGLSPPGKQKSARATTPDHRVIIGSGAGLYGRWLRRIDIHDGLLPASLALAGQVSGGGVRSELQQLTLAAYRANHPSVLHD